MCCPIVYRPQPAVLLAAGPGGGGGGGGGDGENVTNKGGGRSIAFNASMVLERLSMPHCGVVVFSRGGMCNEITHVSQLESAAKSAGAAGRGLASLTDSLLLAGAQSCVMPLWNSPVASLPNLLLLLRFYNELPRVATEERPVATALRVAQQWLRRSSFSELRKEVVTSRVLESTKRLVEAQLWDLLQGRNYLSGKAAAAAKTAADTGSMASMEPMPSVWKGPCVGVCVRSFVRSFVVKFNPMKRNGTTRHDTKRHETKRHETKSNETQ